MNTPNNNNNNNSNDDHDVLDIEDYATRGVAPPRDAKRYRIRIDKVRYVVDVSSMTGREILVLAGKDPANTRLIQRFAGGETEKIEIDAVVDFAKPGVERFVTMKVTQTEGESADGRRAFVFSEADTRYLNSQKLGWETIVDGGARWLIVKNFPIPPGYNVTHADLALEIPATYPDTQIDMAFFFPPLSLQSGKRINAIDGRRSCDQRQFQQWSRHRTPADPWRPGTDDLSTHVHTTIAWLERELGR